MHSLNLYLLTRVTDPELFSLFERQLSARENERRTGLREQESLRRLVSALLACQSPEKPLSLRDLDGFYFSYTIRHISKEFDLLKLAADRSTILNIELKSEDIGQERIRAQLLQNRYYLGHISRKIRSFSYVSSTDTLYELNAHDYLVQAPMSALFDAVRDPALGTYIETDIDACFDTAGYLISPVSTPERFLRGEYFLTNQQEEFRKNILADIRNGKRPYYAAVCGSAGTGKTLMLYDLAVDLSKKKHVLLIHCGPLCEGHRIIDQRLKHVHIVTPEWIREENQAYDVIMIDETGRLALEKMKALEAYVGRTGAVCIFSFDAERLRFADENASRLYLDLVRRADRICELSGNIRINKGLASFRRYLFNRNDVPADRSFPDVELYFAHGARELRRLISYCRGRGYRTIDKCSYKNEKTGGSSARAEMNEPGWDMEPDEESGISERNTEDCVRETCLLPEDLIGQEYDRAAVILDGRFSYEGGHLRGGKTDEESRENLAYLYDAVSRAREKLALLVFDNQELLDDLLRMLAPGENKET
ncbi:MAG: hypothetical protein SOH48_08670 [Eubacteriales bacterium]|jgi:hypothetical protein